MKAVLFPAPETISVEYMPDPVCGPDEVVVQVASCGICGTDLHIYRNEYMSDFPLIPGHEFSGRVVEVGSAVTDLAIGDRVTVDPILDCGHCIFCLDEMANHCLNWVGVGITRPGGKDWTIIGSFAACHTFQPAIAWLANRVVDVAPLVSHTVPMDSFAHAFHQFARGETLKVHIEAGSET